MRDLGWYLWNAALGIILGVGITAAYVLLFFGGIKIIWMLEGKKK